MKLYYRVLNDETWKEAWNLRLNSTHGTLSTDWAGRWVALPESERVKAENYDLTTTEGRFSPNALQAFLAYSKQNPRTENWTKQQVRAASELDGVCAYNNPQGAFDYACLVRPPAVWALEIVEFAGCDEWTLPPEKNEGGVIIKVVTEKMRYKLKDFKERYGLVVNQDILEISPWLMDSK